MLTQHLRWTLIAGLLFSGIAAVVIGVYLSNIGARTNRSWLSRLGAFLLTLGWAVAVIGMLVALIDMGSAPAP